MRKKRQSTQENFRENLRKLIALYGISQREVARRTNGQVSDRYVGMILKGDYVPTIEVAQHIGEAFGLTGWHMIMPDLPLELARTGKLEKLISGFANTPADTQAYIAAVIEREALPPQEPDDNGDTPPNPQPIAPKPRARKAK